MPEASLLRTKQCRKCHQVLPATQEYFNYDAARLKKNLDPLTTQCKECRNGGYLSHCLLCNASLAGLRRKAYCSLECRVIHKLGGVGARYGRLVVMAYAGQKEQEDASSLVVCCCDCGNETILEHSNLLSGGTKSCGCLRRDRPKGAAHPGWKGGRCMLSNGYMVLKRPEHPNAMKDGYVLEHVFVMSEFLGRPLRPGETVHHKNGIRDDNRLENLELWTQAQPAGQRAEDVYTFCKAYIAQYEADVQRLQQQRSLTP